MSPPIRRTLLIVDDSPEDRVILRRALARDTHALYQFVEAELGNMGLDYCQNTAFDCIMLDYHLPDMDAVEFLVALTGPDGLLTQPVVVMTSQGDENTAVQAMLHGAQDYLVKSRAAPQQLQRAVFNAIEKWHMQRQISEQHRSIARSEVALRTANAELEQRVTERTHELVAANDLLRLAIMEKEVLLREIHHRVKNNLQVVFSLLRLQMRETTDAGARGALLASQQRVRSMALIHETLYQSPDLAQVNFATYLQQLASQIGRSYSVEPGNFEVRVEAEQVQLDLDTAIPCGLIATELISNALKYAFPNRHCGTIVVRLQLAGPNQARLEIHDNGVGFAQVADQQQSSAMGMHLVEQLVEQLDGSLAVTHHNGAAITVTFPLPKR